MTTTTTMIYECPEIRKKGESTPLTPGLPFQDLPRGKELGRRYGKEGTRKRRSELDVTCVSDSLDSCEVCDCTAQGSSDTLFLLGPVVSS